MALEETIKAHYQQKGVSAADLGVLLNTVAERAAASTRKAMAKEVKELENSMRTSPDTLTMVTSSNRVPTEQAVQKVTQATPTDSHWEKPATLQTHMVELRKDPLHGVSLYDSPTPQLILEARREVLKERRLEEEAVEATTSEEDTPAGNQLAKEARQGRRNRSKARRESIPIAGTQPPRA